MFQVIIEKLAWPKLKEDILNYNFNSFKADFSAGALVAAVGFPSLMAFALLAGLSPVYGLYSFIVAAIVGTFVGVSKYIIWGPSNIIALMIASALGAFAVTGPAKIEVVILLTFMVGAIEITLSFLNFGKLTHYISRSVIAGLTAGIGIVIAVGQLAKILGLKGSVSKSVFSSLRYIIINVGEINLYTFLVALITFISILAVKKFIPKSPYYLIGLIFTALIVYFFGLDSEITMVGSLKSSFAGITFPNFDMNMMVRLSSYAFAIAILGFLEILVVTEFNRKGAMHKEQVNKEFFGLGITNVACSLFNGFAGGSSFSRSFTNYEAGAKTRFSQLIAGILVLLFLIFFSKAIGFLPIASLGAILILIAIRMINLEEIKTIFKASRFDTLIFIATFLATIFIPRLDYAVYSGILFSLLMVIKDTNNLNYSYLKIDKEGVAQRQAEEIKGEKEIIIDLSGTLRFNAVDKLEKQLEESIELGDSFIIRMRGVEKIDLTTLSELENFIDDVRKRGGDVYFTGLSKKIKKKFKECGLSKKLGKDNFFSKNDKFFSSSKTALKEAKENNHDSDN